MSQLITLMYHSIYSTDEECQQIKKEDLQYALHLDIFLEHLDYLLENGFNIINPLDLTPVTNNNKSILITFDDGHMGFYQYAYPALIKRNLSAIFFITPDLIDKQKPSEYCSWEQLKSMADAGMCIQSHGQSHDFFSDMTVAQSKDELKSSQSQIESHTNLAVWAISFPGGRYSSRDIKFGQAQGYSHFFTSDYGIDTQKHLVNGGSYYRHAIRIDTDLNKFKNILNTNGASYLKKKSIFLLKKWFKLIIGNKNYHKIYILLR